MGRDPLARRDSSVPTMEGKKPSCPRECVPVSSFQLGPMQAGPLLFILLPPLGPFVHCARCMRSSCPPWTGLAMPYSKSTRLVMRCRQQQSDESHPCSISSRSSRHARIPFHLNPSARPRYQTWTRSCWSFHDDRYDRARGLSHPGAPFGQQLPGRGRGQGGARSLCSHTDISSCRLTWHPGSLTVGTPPTGVHGAESMQALYTA